MAQAIEFRQATVTNCDFIGRTVHGIVAVVIEDGVEVFVSKPHVKRIGCRDEVAAFLANR
jgi:hypothetical protein